jgi:dsDNA-specific endonuclease/ATPase MutS2
MSSLARLKFDVPSGVFENASAEFDEELLTPTYRLLWGIPGRSCALSVAAGLGLPQRILEEAKEVIGSSQVAFPAYLHAPCVYL